MIVYVVIDLNEKNNVFGNLIKEPIHAALQ